MRAVWRWLLRLYPRAHQTAFSEEMLAVILKSTEEHRARGRLDSLSFAAAECLGLLRGACRERFFSAAPIGAGAAAVVGGIAVTLGFQASLYLATARASRLAEAAIQRANLPPDPSVAALTVAVFAVAALVCLLPVFFLLSTHLRRGRR